MPAVQASAGQFDGARGIGLGSVLWLYGTDDITSPNTVTYNVVNKMVANGNDINLSVLEGAGHYEVPVVGLPLVQARLRQLFALG